MTVLDRVRSQKGFSLIELMIVVAVIAILASLAYPSYMDSVRKSRRGQAKADMVAAAQVLERYHTQFNTYVGADIPLARSPATGSDYYELKADDGRTANAFSIVATAKGGQTKDRCTSLTLNQAGQKGASPGSVAECW